MKIAPSKNAPMKATVVRKGGASDVPPEATPAMSTQREVGWSGNIGRDEAEQKLAGLPKGAFLVRWSNPTRSYVLSYSKGTTYAHVGKIFPGDNGSVTVETTESTSVSFNSLSAFVSNTKGKGIINNPIPI